MKEKEELRLKELKEFETKLHNEYGIEYICGIDEAGRGPLAGPVAVAAVIMPKDSFIEGVNDSKKISEKKREMLYEKIKEEAIDWSVILLDEKEIDELNILNATKKALTMAIKDLKVKPDRIVADALEHIEFISRYLWTTFQEIEYGKNSHKILDYQEYVQKNKKKNKLKRLVKEYHKDLDLDQ